MRLDFELKEIEFFKNYKSLGVAFRNFIAEEPMFPCVSVTGCGTMIKIRTLDGDPVTQSATPAPDRMVPAMRPASCDSVSPRYCSV